MDNEFQEWKFEKLFEHVQMLENLLTTKAAEQKVSLTSVFHSCLSTQSQFHFIQINYQGEDGMEWSVRDEAEERHNVFVPEQEILIDESGKADFQYRFVTESESETELLTGQINFFHRGYVGHFTTLDYLKYKRVKENAKKA